MDKNLDFDNKDESISEENEHEIKLDADFVDYMKDYFERTEPKLSDEQRQELINLPYTHKRKSLETERKPNNSDWLSWIKPMDFPIIQLATLVFLIVLSGGVYYFFSHKNTSVPIANYSGISSPKPIATTPIPISTSSLNTAENNKENQNNKLNMPSNIESQQGKPNKNTSDKYDNAIAKNSSNEQTSIKKASRAPTAKIEKIKNTNLDSVKSFYVKELEGKLDHNENWYLDFFNELKSQTQAYWIIKDNRNEAANMEVGFTVDGDNNIILKDQKKKVVFTSNVKLGIGDPKEAADKIIEQLKEKINITSTENTSESKK